MHGGTEVRPRRFRAVACLSPGARLFRASVPPCLCAVLFARSLSAQEVPADTTRPPADTTAADSLPADSLRPVLPVFGPPAGPLPQGRRIVLTQRDIRFTGALTLGELLRQVLPGAYLVRGGWFGQTETIALAGQAAGSLEIYWDGFQVDAVGADSLDQDLERYDLGFFRRIEIEVGPTAARVYLISDTPTVRRPRTEVSFSSGDVETNGYRVRYLNRWAGGFGLGLGVSFLGSNGPSYSRAKVSNLGLWAKATWMASDRLGIEWQGTRAMLERDRLEPSGTGAVLAALDGRRTDSFLRAFAATGSDGMGWRLDAVVGTTTWSDAVDTTLDTTAAQAILAISHRADRWSVEATGRLRDGDTPTDLLLRGAWSALRPVSVFAAARRRSLLTGGGLTDIEGGAELRPLNFLRLHGMLRARRLEDRVRIGADTAVTATDWSAGAGLTHRGRLDLDLSFASHDPFAATPFGRFRQSLPGATNAGATTITTAWTLRPYRWLTLTGWYRHPLETDLVGYEPPHHSLTRVVFRSGFLPHFRQGAFDVMGQVELEAWGTGARGLDGGGNTVELPGRSVFNVHIQFRLLDAVLYWTLRNPLLARYDVVPGFPMPRTLQRFGIVWEFTN